MGERQTTDLVVNALVMALARRAPDGELLQRLVEPGQFTSVRYGERLAELGAVPSIGSVGESFDNALAESVNALYKTELIYGPDQGPWKTVEDFELATLSWVHCHNTARLHSHSSDVPPDEFEAAFYAADQATPEGSETNNPSLQPGRFRVPCSRCSFRPRVGITTSTSARSRPSHGCSLLRDVARRRALRHRRTVPASQGSLSHPRPN